MELKTKVNAEDGRQDLTITRDFDLPLELLFKAFSEPELIEQWMGTKVLRFEGKKFGGWEFETSNPKGDVVFKAHGVIHEFTANKRIVRTFEMAGVPFGAQLEVSEFEALTPDISRVNMHLIFESGAQRDEQLKLPFKQGINWAHNRLEEIMSKLK